VAKALGNTKAVCRKCYVHPAVFETYLEGRLAEVMNGAGEEKAIVALLKARLRREADRTSLVPALARSLAAAARRLQHKPQPVARGIP
jgi:DNA topoisomerase-1